MTITALFSRLTDDGQVSPSVYETARLVALAPELDGHTERVRFLLDRQHADGSWGEPDGYGVVPTLSAVDALLGIGHPAAQRGLDRLPCDIDLAALPDTIAVELVVPALVASINRRLRRDWLHVDDGTLRALRHAVSDGQPLPEKVWHSLETLGDLAYHAPGVVPVNGVVGNSAAATAAWHGCPSDYVIDLQRRYGGPVPGISPITYFERAWIVAALDAPIPDAVSAPLREALGAEGAPAGPGLLADADDTASVLFALRKLGLPAPLDALWRYESDDYFVCFLGERTPSTSTNAHILKVLPPGSSSALKVAGWLRDQQSADGSWTDKWHASPYYATACCVRALHGDDKAARWVLDTQRDDGSWGRWQGTVEETAYAIRTLLASSFDATDAIARGRAFLRANPDFDHQPLWHDKDLYAPIAVIEAERLGVL